MKKQLIPTIIISTILIIVCCFGAWIVFSIFDTPEQNDNSNTLHWIAEESYFVDYEIIGDTVKFRYSICFENNSDEDDTISILAKFKKSELKDWIKADEFIFGCDETGERLYEEIKKGEKKNVVFVFEGEYLGGEVNTNLSFPDEIMYVIS